jgi:hypothetical protein
MGDSRRFLLWLAVLAATPWSAGLFASEMPDSTAIFSPGSLRSGYFKYTFSQTMIDTSLAEIERQRSLLPGGTTSSSNKIVTVARTMNEYEYFFKGEKRRILEKDMQTLLPNAIFTGETLRIYDGDTVYELGNGLTRQSYKPVTIARINSKNGFVMVNDILRHYSIIGGPIAGFLEGNYRGKKVASFRFAGNEPLRGETNAVYDMVTSDVPIAYRVWLSPSRQYLPTHIEITNSQNQSTTVYDYSYDRGPNGIPILKNITTEYRIKNVPKSRSELAVTEAAVNIDLPDSLFVMHFPENVRVQDISSMARPDSTVIKVIEQFQESSEYQNFRKNNVFK